MIISMGVFIMGYLNVAVDKYEIMMGYHQQLERYNGIISWDI